MIQIIGILELIIFYTAYFVKILNQKKKGIITDQLGKGKKKNVPFLLRDF